MSGYPQGKMEQNTVDITACVTDGEAKPGVGEGLSSIEQQTVQTHLAMMRAALTAPLDINVACENDECMSLLKVSVPENVHKLAPPSLVIRCAGCGKLLSVSLPEETYIQHRQNQLKIIQEKQERLQQLQRLQNELLLQQQSIEQMSQQLLANANQGPAIGTPTLDNMMKSSSAKDVGNMSAVDPDLNTPDIIRKTVRYNNNS